jgi:hypothetical protein
MTEFTAFLATEPGVTHLDALSRTEESLARASSAKGGAWGVGQAQNSSRLSRAPAPAAMGGGMGGGGGFAANYGAAAPVVVTGTPSIRSNQAYIDAEGRVQQVGGVQNVGRQTFYRQGNAWVDQRAGAKTPTVKIQRLSEAHLQLARASAEARRYLALGDDVTFVMNGQAVVIGDTGKTQLTAAELKGLVGSG